MRRISVLCLLVLCSLPAFPASARAAAFLSPGRPGRTQAAPPSVGQDPLGRTTPQGTVLGFIRAAQDQNWPRAVQYLDTSLSPKAAEELARQLKVTLDNGLPTEDLSTLSANPQGNMQDGLPPDQELLGVATVGSAKLNVLLLRVPQSQGPPIWLVSPETLRGVPAIYEEIKAPWFQKFMWKPLREIRILNFPLWAWLAVVLAIPFVILFVRVFTSVVVSLLRRIIHRLTGEPDDPRLRKIILPVRLLSLAMAIVIGTWLIDLPLLARYFWIRVASALVILAVTWLVLRTVDVVAELTVAHLQRVNRKDQIALTHLLRRLAAAAMIILATLTFLYLANIDLTAALAGLGIGGLAIAFAAQKTLENLFGGIMIITDRPVRVGDFCRIGDYVGTVEDVGLRSTRIRTLDRTMLSIPNGQLAAMNVENFAVRDKIWFHPTIGVRYETSADQLRYILAEIRKLLYAHPKVETGSARIRFVRFGGSSLDLEIFSYILTADYGTFVEIQEDLLLRIMDIIEASGTGVAFPSSTLYVARDSGLNAAKAQAAVATVQAWRQTQKLPFPNFPPEHIAAVENTLEYPEAGSALHRAGPEK